MDYNEITKRIDELNLDGYKHIKNNDWGSSLYLENWLKSKNFKLLGTGNYSSVYKSTTENFVIKINRGVFDPGYVDFVEFCHKNKNNIHLPKIGSLKKYAIWYLVFIEELQPVSSTDIGFKSGGDMREYFQEIIKEQIVEKTELLSLYKKYNSDNSVFSSNILQISDICKILLEFTSQYNISYNRIDLHHNNFMLRGDKLVIIDPVMN